MRRAFGLLLGLSALTLAEFAQPSRTLGASPVPAASRPAAQETYLNPALMLPDSAWLARVDNHVITVGEYLERWFASWPPDLPASDSAGRAEFLNSMITKEVLAGVARRVNRPMGFEDRLVLREHSQRVLSNALFQRAVIESVVITDKEIDRLYEQFRYEQHLRHGGRRHQHAFGFDRDH
jgi:hypothetical protein